MVFATIACAQDPQIVTNEVTREVPVTVETLQTVEVTRQVSVTVEIERQTEVTRIVETTREVPVTRLVKVTPIATAHQATPTERVSASPTPPITETATPEPIATPAMMVATPPTPTIPPSPTPTPKPETHVQYGSWQLQSLEQFGNVSVAHFENKARKWEAGALTPTLTFKCDNWNRRSLYIDWDFALSTEVSYVPRYTNDPFRQYQDNDLDALADMAYQMLTFINGAEFYRADVGKLDQLWKSLRTHWDLDAEKAASLIERIKERNLRGVLILSAFYTHRKDHPAGLKYGPTWVEEISSTWVVLPGHRTQMDSGELGSLRQIYRNVDSAATPGSDTDRLLIATVREPQQVAPIMAEWEISGLDKVLNHCRAFGP